MGSVIRVEAEGLHSLGLKCHGFAGDLVASSSAPEVAGVNGQATVAAVQAVNAGVLSASEAMASRMSATGTKLMESAASYTSGDARSARNIAAVSPTYLA